MFHRFGMKPDVARCEKSSYSILRHFTVVLGLRKFLKDVQECKNLPRFHSHVNEGGLICCTKRGIDQRNFDVRRRANSFADFASCHCLISILCTSVGGGNLRCLQFQVRVRQVNWAPEWHSQKTKRHQKQRCCHAARLD